MKILLAFIGLLALASVTAQAQGPVESDVVLEETSFAPQFARVEATVYVNGTIYNPSSVAANAQVEARYEDGTPVASSDEFGYQRAILPGDRARFSIAFIPELDRAGARSVTVVARVAGDPNASNNQLTRPIFLHAPALSLAVEGPFEGVLPEGFGFVRFTLRNDGNAADRPRLDLTVKAPWNATLHDPIPWLAPKSSIGGIVVVGPGSAKATEPLDLKIRAVSSLAPDVHATGTAAAVLTDPGGASRIHAVAIEGLPERLQIGRTETLTVPFTLRNTGERGDVYRPSVAFSDPKSGWSVSITRPEGDLDHSLARIGLKAGEARPFVLRIERNDGGLGAGQEVDLSVVSLQSALLAAHVDRNHSASTKIGILEAAPDVRVVGVAIPLSIYRNDVFTLSADFSNEGRLEATNGSIELVVRDKLRTVVTIEKPLAPLAPGATHRETWSLDVRDLVGPHAIVVRVTVPFESFEADNLLTTEFYVRSPVFTLRAPAEINVTSGAKVGFGGEGLVLDHAGDRSEVIEVVLRSPFAWLNGSWTLDVPARTRVIVPVDIRAPTRPGFLEADVVIEAHVVARSSFRTSSTLLARHDDREGPRLEFLAPKGPSTAGKSVEIEVLAMDATGVGPVEAFVTDPDGARIRVALEARGDDRWSGFFTPSEVGRHAIEIRATDVSRRSHASHLVAPEWTVAESIYPGFSPGNFGDNAAFGLTALRFVEIEPGSTRRFEIDVGRGFVQVPFPYEWIIGSESEGPLLLSARALSLEGAVWNASWTILVDRTPPVLREARVVEASDGRLLLAVTAEGAEAVEAIVHGRGQPLRASLEMGSEGEASGTVPAPLDWSRVEFVARDEAGLVASLSVDAPKRGGQPIPGLEVGVFAIALVAAARGVGKRKETEGPAPKRRDP